MEPTQQDILRVYDAVADSAVWTEVMDRLVQRLHAKGSILFEWVEQDGERELTTPIHSGSYHPDTLASYLKTCAHLEARDQQVIRDRTSSADTIEVIDDSALDTPEHPLADQEHVKKLQKLGVSYRAAGVLNKDNRWLCLMTLQFGPDNPALTNEQMHYLSMLLPHIAKAFDLAIPLRQLKATSESVLSATDRLCIGICILDPQGRVVHRNEEFKRQQQSYHLFHTTPAGTLTIRCHSAQAQLQKLKADVRHHGKHSARPRKEAIPISQDSFLCLELTPLNHSEEMGTQPFEGYVLYSTDTSLPVNCNPAPMKAAFGLTDTELDIIEGIGLGLTNPEIAEQRDRSVATINSQVKSILAKSQCATRTQLVRMMMRFGASFLQQP